MDNSDVDSSTQTCCTGQSREARLASVKTMILLQTGGAERAVFTLRRHVSPAGLRVLPHNETETTGIISLLSHGQNEETDGPDPRRFIRSFDVPRLFPGSHTRTFYSRISKEPRTKRGMHICATWRIRWIELARLCCVTIGEADEMSFGRYARENQGTMC